MLLSRLPKRRNDSYEGRERSRAVKFSGIPHSRQDLGSGLGADAVDRTVETAVRLGIGTLTLFG